MNRFCSLLIFVVIAFSTILQQTSSFFHSHLKARHIRKNLDIHAKLVVGLNKYSHDASCCILDGDSGKILFAQSKERVSRRKHDGGAVGELILHGLESIGADASDIEVVVSNNHHHRVIPFERRFPFYGPLTYISKDYLDPMNLLPNAKHYELSHHLAHAWSGVFTSNFDHGLIVVMDGMGETYRAMREDITKLEENSGEYMHDLKLLRDPSMDHSKFVGVPTALAPSSGYREAESGYIFDKKLNLIKPIFKRWSRERSPPELYNHGFENHESLGAVYSRISSQIFGDWNACGKVMGLAPWKGKQTSDLENWYFSNQKSTNGAAAAAVASGSSEVADSVGGPADNGNLQPSNLNNVIGTEFYHQQKFMTGNPFLENDFQIDWKALEALPFPNEFQQGNHKLDYYAHLAHSVQQDLEVSAMALVSSLKDAAAQNSDLATGGPDYGSKLVLTGGVALNSVLNGRIMREGGFEQIHIPPAPGDEGIAIGCANFGLSVLRSQNSLASSPGASSSSSSSSSASSSGIIELSEPDSEPEHNHDHGHSHEHCDSHSHSHDHNQGCGNTDASHTRDGSCGGDNIAADHDHSADNLNHAEVELIMPTTSPSEPTSTVDFVANTPTELTDTAITDSSLTEAITTAREPFSAYQGREYSKEDVEDVLLEFGPWLKIDEHSSDDSMVEAAANRLSEGQVIAWFQGRSEFGQRALGSRSILADPRQPKLRKFINEEIKQREWFRPLAPSVLGSLVGDWFDGLENDKDSSPYMSITAFIKESKRDEIPAVCHVDGSARLQTVSEIANPLYHKLISEFCKRTGVPMVLNTSLNRKSEPIVESPEDAIKLLIACNNKISTLFIGNFEVHVKPFPFDSSGLAALASEPSSDEADILVFAKRYYISEVTASPFTPDKPVRIRIQTGESSSDLSQSGWTTLPSTLHLELLQLLQVPPDADYEGGEEVADILDAIRTVRDEDLSWQEVKEVLRWLYYEGIVSFREADEVSPGSGMEAESEPVSGESVDDEFAGGILKSVSDMEQAQQASELSQLEEKTVATSNSNTSTAEPRAVTAASNKTSTAPPAQEEEDDEMITDDDIDFEGLFKGVDIVDLRE